MTKLRVNCFGVSLDGYGAGPDQSLETPLGIGGEDLHTGMVATRTFREMWGKEGGTTGVDDRFAAAGFENVGAWILGRNMFAWSRGPWPDNDPWQGWWGDTPPYHCPVFVLTHYARDPIEMKGGTTFHFVTGGIHEAWERAQAAADGKDVRLGGGTATVREYLEARILDTLHLAVAPVLLGSGEALFAGLDLPALRYRVAQIVPGEGATHVLLSQARS